METEAVKETQIAKEVDIATSRSYFLKGVIFFYFASIGVLLPFLPVYFQHKGLNVYQIGILLAIGPFVSMSVQSLWGFLSDRFSTVKRIVLVQLLVSVVLSNFVFTSNTFDLLVVNLLAFYAFSWPLIPLLDSLTLGTVKATGEHYGSYRFYGSVGFGLTALGAGKLFGVIGIDNIRFVYIALLIICIFLCLWISDARYSGRPPGLRQLGGLMKRRDIISFLLVIALVSSTNKANDAFMSIFIKSLGGTEIDVGMAWTVAPLSEAVVFFLAGAFMGRFHELALLTVASAAFTLRWLLFTVAASAKIMILIQFLHSLSFALFFISAISYMAKMVPDRLRASGQGLLSSFMGGVAGIIGSMAGGAVMSLWGPRVLYGLCAALSLTACLAFYYQYIRINCRERS